MLTTRPVLHYFDPTKPVEIQADASQSSLGAVLQVDGKVVEYASRAMTEAEKGYAQIEKELLSLVFAVGRWDVYPYGRRIRAYTDHKPLIGIHKGTGLSAKASIQPMLVRLQRYDIQLLYRPGRPPAGSQLILADSLSRALPPTAADSVYGGRRDLSYS